MRERDRIHTTFITVYCYDCSILLVVTVVSLVLCLMYKFNFIIDKYIWEKTGSCTVCDVRHSLGVLE